MLLLCRKCTAERLSDDKGKNKDGGEREDRPERVTFSRQAVD